MDKPLLSVPSERPIDEEQVNPIPEQENPDEQDDLDVNKGIVKHIDELKEIIETKYPDPSEDEQDPSADEQSN